MTSVYVKTFGCSLNQADSEIMSGLLLQSKFQLAESAKQADLVIVNSCTVKQPTENKVFSYLNSLGSPGKPVVIAGCIPQATPELVEGYSLVGTSSIHDIVSVVEETLAGNVVTLIADAKCQRLSLPKVRKNPVIEIIPISDGCLGECSYCIVKQARGNLRSNSIEHIVRNARNALKEGVKEIWLTAQDTGCYGKDIGTNLPQLIGEMTALQRGFFIRIGMMNPKHVKEFLHDLIKVYKSDKVFKFLHLPVQSGSDEILNAMKRNYTVSDFVEVVEAFRKEIPSLTLSTDIICGFPGETKKQFMDSVDLIRKTKPDVLNISRFWPRQKTEAKLMPQLSGEETKQRSRFLTSQFDWIAFEANKKWRNWQGPALIDEKGPNHSWIGRNFCYKQVVVNGNYKLGQEVFVRIRETTRFDLRAEVQTDD